MRPTGRAESDFSVHVVINWLAEVRQRLDRAN